MSAAYSPPDYASLLQTLRVVSKHDTTIDVPIYIDPEGYISTTAMCSPFKKKYFNYAAGEKAKAFIAAVTKAANKPAVKFERKRSTEGSFVLVPIALDLAGALNADLKAQLFILFGIRLTAMYSSAEYEAAEMKRNAEKCIAAYKKQLQETEDKLSNALRMLKDTNVEIKRREDESGDEEEEEEEAEAVQSMPAVAAQIVALGQQLLAQQATQERVHQLQTENKRLQAQLKEHEQAGKRKMEEVCENVVKRLRITTQWVAQQFDIDADDHEDASPNACIVEEMD
jgi:hypothetical protein